MIISQSILLQINVAYPRCFKLYAFLVNFSTYESSYIWLQLNKFLTLNQKFSKNLIARVILFP